MQASVTKQCFCFVLSPIIIKPDGDTAFLLLPLGSKDVKQPT